ncbi:hypothetical protein LCGC14_0729510 [marine sediment metagenome]|uniref:Uncharacterized protein n=1 Tax=marine sediment metagenome TaxID=412755 RepID=A0A0F9QE75_9ZZZZ
MKLNNESIELAKQIADTFYLGDTVKDKNEFITTTAKMIEEIFGNSQNARLRRKVKDQASSLKQLHRAHTALKHDSRKYLESLRKEKKND